MTLPMNRAQTPAEAIDFIRFCHRRRRVGWPEIYDEMCGVAARGLYKGWSHDELARYGITFSLAGMPALAALVRIVLQEEAPAAAVRGRARPPVGIPVVTADSAEPRCTRTELLAQRAEPVAAERPLEPSSPADEALSIA
jgi:hypothetical protein